MLTRRFTEDDLDDAEFQEYIASEGSDDSEEEEEEEEEEEKEEEGSDDDVVEQKTVTGTRLEEQKLKKEQKEKRAKRPKMSIDKYRALLGLSSSTHSEGEGEGEDDEQAPKQLLFNNESNSDEKRRNIIGKFLYKQIR